MDAVASYLEVRAGIYIDWDYPKNAIALEKRLREDYFLDDLDIAYLLEHVEEKCQINFGNVQPSDFKCIGDIIKKLKD